MRRRFKVIVTDLGSQKTLEEIHQAEGWMSAVLYHSMVGAEFEGLVDELDFEERCEYYGYRIQVLPL
jgi:hypothetical protein